jgi:hypothetical protein
LTERRAWPFREPDTDLLELEPLQTFRLPQARADVEAACRRALRNVDWQELPSDKFEREVPASGHANVLGELLIWLIEVIPPVRRLFARARTITRHAPPPSRGSEAVIYAVWSQVVMVTISLHELAGIGTAVTIAGQGGMQGKAAAIVSELRRSIEIQSGSLTTSLRP